MVPDWSEFLLKNKKSGVSIALWSKRKVSAWVRIYV